MPFITGKQSKLAKLIEMLIVEQIPVEIVFVDGEVLYGTLTSYELSSEHLIITVKGSPNFHVVNFRHVLRMRIKKTDKIR